MVGSRTTTTTDQMSYIRKIRKPMVEKKRRDRINNSVAQLKSLIAHTIKQHATPMPRVDKADILELTVYHLTQLQQQQQRSLTLATEAAAYNAGYSACAREAVRYISSTRMTNPATTGSLSNHLNSTLLQQNTVKRNGGHLHHSCDTSSRVQMDRLSTPLRPCDSINSPLPEMNFYGYSPIHDGANNLPELTSSFVYASLNSCSSVDFSSSYSSASISSSDSSQSLTHGDGVREEQEITHTDRSTDVVKIGHGEENEIGYVIKEVPWRPF